MTNATGAVYEFGSFRLDPAKRLLTRGGEHLTLPPKTFDLLLLLVQSHGRVFAKKELMTTLWPDTFVEDANLSFQVSTLRKILGGEGIEWIETLPRYGYRFAGNVLEVDTHPPIEISVWTAPEPVGAPAPEAKLPAEVGGKRIPLYYWVPMAVVTIIAGYLAVVHISEKSPEKLPISFLITPPDLVTISDVDPIAVSPNGDRVLFMGEGPEGGKQLWVRALGSLTASVIAGTEQVDGAFWSPDGRSIAFIAAGKLKKMDLQSGVPQTIGDTPSSPASGSWSQNGVILFQTNQRSEIFRVDPGTDQPKLATHLNLSNHETRHSAPQFLPDGRRFIYFVQSERPENSGIYLGSLDGSASQRLTDSSASAVYTRMIGTDYLLFARDTNLMGQAFDVTKGKLLGTAFVVAPRLLIADSGGHPRASLSASQNGVLAYRTRVDTGATDLTWIDRGGRRLGSLGESGEFSNPAVSPDGKKLLISRMDSEIRTRDLWLHDFSNGSSSRLTFNAADETNPVWSPDGSRIAYDALHEGVIDLYEMEIAGVPRQSSSCTPTKISTFTSGPLTEAFFCSGPVQ
jgi:DNA-binding winged helix-turn-helix (wHTH) protein/Tol biopolymer transport system component